MSKYILIRRLRGPAYLLLVGALALLNQADILSWGKSWPFFLILAGVLALAERAALAADGDAYQAQQYPGAPYGTGPAPGAAPAPQSTAIVPTHNGEYENDPNGGQS